MLVVVQNTKGLVRLCDVDPVGQVYSSGDLWEDGSGTEKGRDALRIGKPS